MKQKSVKRKLSKNFPNLSDLAYFLKVCRNRSWCVWGSADIPCARRVRGPMICALGKTDWHLCSFLLSSWISSSLSSKRLSKSRILSSFNIKIFAKSSSRSLIMKFWQTSPDVPKKTQSQRPTTFKTRQWILKMAGMSSIPNPRVYG